MTRSLILILGVLAVSGCNPFGTGATTVIVPQSAPVTPQAGCVDGFGPIQSGTAICVGASG